MDIILDKLNEEQYESAVSEANYLQISAGPGTGKTSTLAARIFYKQFSEGLNPDELIAISFSRSAKEQLIHKMQEYTDLMGYGSIIDIMTFHSLAHRIIRYGVFTGETEFRDGFRVVNTEDYYKINPEIIKDLCKEYASRELAAQALAKCLNLLRQGSHLENDVLIHWSAIKPGKVYKINMDASTRINIHSPDIIEYWKRVERLFKIRNELDYQGLITEAVNLLLKKKNTYNIITGELKHIFVDEYQDTSISQENLLVALAAEKQDITVVGDENQTIYTFNGSNLENMKRFLKRFENIPNKKCRQIHLKQNYRSTKSLINLSNHLLERELITPTDITPYKEDYQPVIVDTQSIELAAVYIAREIYHLNIVENVALTDICVLFRKDSEHSPQLESLKKELDLLNISYDENARETEKKADVKKEILSLYEKYPDHELSELLELIKEDNFSEEAAIFIKDAIEMGAKESEELIDYLIDMDEKRFTDNDSKIKLRTVHSSKGQEYQIVFVLYLGDRQFPHGSNPDVEEEKRLLYVAVTRAIDRLYILGKHGVHAEDFLGKCITAPNINYVLFNTRVEKEYLEGYGLSQADKEIIRETSKEQEYKNDQNKKRLTKYMEEW
ncbi:UvrD-helicase domain-containing protein [Jeotgalibacillus sp. R-1-5s-1]|uniref:UvrD-helicase domain-containing protein n=1 Tax=Jeotgalibacillus sp. R-1-5s-1 TaxID=2555897 RepID=UPI00106CA89A|nr:ATP-dependent helicase [Jeotgalibacillus sp. R-1-5s-1]TFD99519.1 ATP-dependent helicase [Jeotgalibacillus sp. R-1-5s-1]